MMLPSWTKGSQEPDRIDRSRESTITSLSFHCVLQSATESFNTPSAKIWTCRSRVIRMQANEYVRKVILRVKWNASILKYDKYK